jgi:4-hydroxymandelate oxidase
MKTARPPQGHRAVALRGAARSDGGVDDLLNLFDFERAAQDRLPPLARDYYASGAMDELTLAANRRAFEERSLAYRVLVDVAQRSARANILGLDLAIPLLVAPTAFQCLATPEGEVATARAAANQGTAMVLSSLSNRAVEDVVAASAAPLLFQLYMYRDRGASKALVERVEAAGCQALVLTVDAPLLGRRERDVRNRFQLPQGLAVPNLVAAGYGGLPAAPGGSGLAAAFAQLLDPSLSWADLEWLASITKLPVVLKGVVRADDGRRAVDHGVAGLVVSNHGGRQLDTAPATLDALPAIAEAVGDDLCLLLDGGVRRGTDVVKALALGAHAVLIGRPILWGLAVGGEAGAARVLKLMADEIDLAMALCGARTLAEVSRDLVV